MATAHRSISIDDATATPGPSLVAPALTCYISASLKDPDCTPLLGFAWCELVANAHRDEWREVLILAAGVAEESDVEELVIGVVERGDKETNHRARLYLLAIACRQAAVRFSEGCQIPDTVRDRLRKIVPPPNFGVAKELSSAGDLVDPFLEYNSEWTGANLDAVE